jgi:hypothetical protein
MTLAEAKVIIFFQECINEIAVTLRREQLETISSALDTPQKIWLMELLKIVAPNVPANETRDAWESLVTQATAVEGSSSDAFRAEVDEGFDAVNNGLRTCPSCHRVFAMLHICENCGRCDGWDLPRDADREAPCCNKDTCAQRDWRSEMIPDPPRHLTEQTWTHEQRTDGVYLVGEDGSAILKLCRPDEASDLLIAGYVMGLQVDKLSSAKAEEAVHILTQEGQPYGSERRCCNHCGVVIWGSPAPRYEDNWNDWYEATNRCSVKNP